MDVARGEHILRITEDAELRRSSEQGHALLDAISQAHRAKVDKE
ncbi:MAG TPA: hypothetical protein VE525_18750 [Rubrobacter sp.]|nr:hypothetical protein [Rubrobacter sp.]